MSYVTVDVDLARLLPSLIRDAVKAEVEPLYTKMANQENLLSNLQYQMSEISHQLCSSKTSPCATSLPPPAFPSYNPSADQPAFMDGPFSHAKNEPSHGDHHDDYTKMSTVDLPMERPSRITRSRHRMHQMNEKSEAPKKIYPCSFGECNSRFSNEYTLFRHMRKHAEAYLECKLCGERFTDGRSFHTHKKNHERPFRCQRCGKKYAEQHTYEDHESVCRTVAGIMEQNRRF